MSSFHKILAVCCVANLFIMPMPVFAEDTASIEQRLGQLEQQVQDLKKQLQQQRQEAAQNARQGTAPQAVNSTPNQTPPAAIVTANSKDGFSIKSPDGNYKLQMGGYIQAEAREFADNKKDLGYESSIIPRRVRLVIQGTVARDFDFYLQPEFGYNNAYSTITSTTPSAYGVALQDAWVDYKYFPWGTIKAGKFKTPFDLENLQDTRYTSFTEIGLTGNLVPQRDVGAQVGGSLLEDRINYAAGIFDGAADHENSYGGYSTASGGDTNNKSGTGRIFVKPFKDTGMDLLSGLGVGYAASYGKEKGSDLPSYISPGQAPVFTYNSNVSAAGPQIRTEPQAFYYYKSLGILAEKVDSQEDLEYKGSVIYRDKPTNKAWEVTGSYVLTGENASYNGVMPDHDFDLSGGHLGAFELVGRYGELKLDSSIFTENFANLNTSISEEKAWAAGINWYLNRNVKLAFGFEQTKFRRGAVNGASTDDRKTENLFTTTLQVSL